MRAVGEEIDDIERTDDSAAKRRVIDLLDFRCGLRIDEVNDQWVDITWLRKVYPRRLSLEGDLGGGAGYIRR